MSAFKWSTVVIALLSATWFLAQGPSPAARAAKSVENTEPAPNGDVEKLQAKVRRLEQRVAEQQSLLQAAEAEPKPTTVALAPPEPDAVPKARLTGEEASARLKAYFAEAFASERYDRSRSDEYLKATREVLEAQDLPTDVLEEMECRESMCRVTIRHSPQLERDAVGQILASGLLRYGSFDFLQGDRTIAYVGAGAPLVTPSPSTLPPTAVATN